MTNDVLLYHGNIKFIVLTFMSSPLDISETILISLRKISVLQ